MSFVFIIPTQAMTREEIVINHLNAHHIPFAIYHHPEGNTIEEARRWWRDDGSVHCKNLFFRNHKGNRHYLVCFPCDLNLDIHHLEATLKASLLQQGLPSCGKLSFASAERMQRYLGLQPGSVSPFGLINDVDGAVHLFLDARLRQATTLSFHPNDSRGTVVIARTDFERYLTTVRSTYEYIAL